MTLSCFRKTRKSETPKGAKGTSYTVCFNKSAPYKPKKSASKKSSSKRSVSKKSSSKRSASKPSPRRSRRVRKQPKRYQ